ncbi:MAG: ShlB/FhaC/HecB family hemolysin secretion/activation protein [Pseudomonadota bacterium]
MEKTWRQTAALGALFALIICMVPHGVVSQTAEQSLRDREAEIEEARPRPAPGPVDIPRATIDAPPGAEDVALDLVSIELVGRDGQPLTAASRLPVAEARALYQDRLNQPATLADIYLVAREVEVLLRREGFVFTRVLVPRQEIDQEAADIQIAVLGITVEAVSVEAPGDPIGPVETLIQELVDPLVGLPNPRIEEIERVSLLATDLPGVTRATFVPSEGSGPEFLVLSLNVERDPFNAVAIVSHRESPAIGPGVFGGTAFANTWGPFGASTSLSFFNSWSVVDSAPDFNERSTVELTQRIFLGTGTSISLSGLYSRTEPDADPFAVSGEQVSVGLGVEHPLFRSRSFSLWVNGGLDWTDSEIDVAGGFGQLTDDSVRAIHAGARGSIQDAYGTTFGDLTLRKGFDILGATSPGDAEVSRVGASGRFLSIRGQIQRNQPIWDGFGARLRMVGQWSPNRLLSSEALGLGGGRYLKGYDPSEQQGDSGFATYGEVSYANDVNLAGVDFGYEVYAFGDYGIVFQADDVKNGTADLVSTGGGFRIRVPSGPRLEFELAQPVSDRLQRTEDNDLRVFGSLIWFF